MYLDVTSHANQFDWYLLVPLFYDFDIFFNLGKALPGLLYYIMLLKLVKN